jgi:hypothetical protein
MSVKREVFKPENWHSYRNGGLAPGYAKKPLAKSSGRIVMTGER